MAKKQAKDTDMCKVDHIRQYKIGTRFITATYQIYKYVKVDHGIVGKIDGKTIRHIEYRWIRTR